MRPADLKPPFLGKERQAFLDKDQKILFAPERCPKGEYKDTLKELFACFPVVRIEYCSGNGDWIVQKAKDNPNILWVAVELKFERVRKIWAKRENSKLSNLFIVYGEAFDSSHHYFEDSIFDEVYVNFPDPWPKRRHAKFRLISEPFVKELSRTLKNEGVINLVTDDFNYADQSIKEFLKQELVPLFSNPYYSSNISDYGSSYFKSLWEEKKRSFYFSKFQKTCKY